MKGPGCQLVGPGPNSTHIKARQRTRVLHPNPRCPTYLKSYRRLETPELRSVAGIQAVRVKGDISTAMASKSLCRFCEDHSVRLFPARKLKLNRYLVAFLCFRRGSSASVEPKQSETGDMKEHSNGLRACLPRPVQALQTIPIGT